MTAVSDLGQLLVRHPLPMQQYLRLHLPAWRQLPVQQPLQVRFIYYHTPQSGVPTVSRHQPQDNSPPTVQSRLCLDISKRKTILPPSSRDNVSTVTSRRTTLPPSSAMPISPDNDALLSSGRSCPPQICRRSSQVTNCDSPELTNHCKYHYIAEHFPPLAYSCLANLT